MGMNVYVKNPILASILSETPNCAILLFFGFWISFPQRGYVCTTRCNQVADEPRGRIRLSGINEQTFGRGLSSSCVLQITSILSHLERREATRWYLVHRTSCNHRTCNTGEMMKG
jgi:hypothetical protein